MNPNTRKKLKTALAAVSVSVNLILLPLFVLAFFIKTPALSFPDPKGGIAAAVIASAPASSVIVFNAVEITLEKGEEAELQFSVFSEGRQMNMLVEALYDHEIISIEKTGCGLLIRALAGGECAVQTVTGEGVKDLVLVRVNE